MIAVILLLFMLISSLYIYEDVKDELILVSPVILAVSLLSVQEDAQLSPSGTTLNYRRGSVPSYLVTNYSRYP